MPLSVKDTGSVTAPLVVPLNPNSAVPPAAMSAFHAAPFAVALPPATVIVDDQAEETCCPLGTSHSSCHPRTASLLPLAIFTLAVKPPFQVLGLV